MLLAIWNVYVEIFSVWERHQLVQCLVNNVDLKRVFLLAEGVSRDTLQ